jgi:hypothetical protein
MTREIRKGLLGDDEVWEVGPFGERKIGTVNQSVLTGEFVGRNNDYDITGTNYDQGKAAGSIKEPEPENPWAPDPNPWAPTSFWDKAKP